MAQEKKRTEYNNYNLEGLSQQYWKEMVYFAYKNIGNLGDAEEIVRNSFVSGAKKLSTEKSQDPKVWLFKITYIEMKNRTDLTIVKRKVANKYQKSPTVKLKISTSETLKVLSDYILKIPEINRAAISLKLLHNLNYNEISIIMDTSVESAKQMTAEGFRTIRHLLGPIMQRLEI